MADTADTEHQRRGRTTALRSHKAMTFAAPLLLIWVSGTARAQSTPTYQFQSSATYSGTAVPGAGAEGCIAATANPGTPIGSQYIFTPIANCNIGGTLTQNQQLNGALGPVEMVGSALQSATPAQVTASVTTASISGASGVYAESVAFYHQDDLPAAAGQTLSLNLLVLSSLTNQGLASGVIVALSTDNATVQTSLFAPLSPAIMTLSPLTIGPSGKFSITVNVLAVQNGGPGTDSVTVLLGCNLPVSGITYACDQSVWNSLPGNVCDTLNSTTAGLYGNAFTNANACIYVQTGNTALAQTVSPPITMTYSAFRSALNASATDANDATAVGDSVPAADPYTGASVQITNPLARALGGSVTTGIQTNGQTPCELGTVGCYDAVVTIGNGVPLYFRSGSISGSQYDFYTLVERQTDEALGTSSCSPNYCTGNIAPADLFRYHSSGTRSFATGTDDACSSGDSTNACFSIDGVHMLQQYNNLNNGEDTGDWAPNCATNPLVQNASGCPGVGNLDISPAAEVLVLDVVGYSLNLTSSVTIQTDPEGLQFSVDGGTAQTAPQTLRLAPGAHTIAVAATQAGTAGTQYVFAGWSDGGAVSHSITAAANSSAAYTASFQTQYQLTVAASPAADGSVTPASGTFYNAGASAAVMATAAGGYAFTSWTGAVANPAGASTTVTMSGPESVTANFAALTGIAIQTVPAGLQFSVDGGATLIAPQTVELTPGSHTISVTATQAGTAGTQYVFASWSDNGAASHSITVGSSQATYTATFQTQYQLTISASPAAGGTITPGSGSYYDAGATVTIGASAASGYAFSGWTGSVGGASSASTTLAMSAPETVVANFAALAGITVQTSPPGLQFSVDGGAAQIAPQALMLSQGSHTIAVAPTQSGAAGTQYTFLAWSDSGLPSHTIIVGTSAATYTATFQTQYQLTISASPAADGTVTPASGGFYNAGASVPIAATAASGFQFASWSGAVASSTSASTTVTMSAPETVAANFTAVAATAGLAFYPVTPCRVADTRNGNGPFGGPIMTAGSTRGFAIPSSACGIPSTAQAYSLNITVVPPAALGYLTAWPTGQAQPYVSTLNSSNGAIVANAAIVPAGGAPSAPRSISIYVSDATHVIIDINGYFGAPSGSGALAFYPVTPCRVADTRNPNGPFGGPLLASGATRDFTVPQSSCGIPTTAQAYSLNMTVVPPGALEYLTAWPTGQAQPYVSTLNALQGQIAANAAIVPAGTNGAISVYVSDPSNVIVDIDGYFAPPGGTGALYFYPVTPCRVADTRNAAGTFGGPSLGSGATRSFPIASSACSIPSAAQAYSLNMTVVPPGSLLYLSAWPAGQTQPVVSTLNDLQGQIVANAAVVPAGAPPNAGSIAVYVSDPTNLVIDINGYFGQ